MYIPIRIKAKNFGPFAELDYHFKQNKAVVVEGLNLTDEGQENNGVGKSYLQEIIYYIFIGSSSSGKRDKKLIRRGEKEAEISLELRNDFYDHTLEIHRKLFKTKSSVLKILINGKDQSDKFPSVVEGNKYLLSLLDISSEDLKNYYLINREKFVSFFSSSDTKKRELIARFSSVDRISGIDEIIDKEIYPLKCDKATCETSIIQSNSRIEVYKEQIQKLQEVDCDSLFKQNQELLKTKIGSIKLRIDSINSELKQNRNLIAQKEIEKIENHRIYMIYCKGKRLVDSLDYSVSIGGKEQELQALRQNLRKRDNHISSKYSEKSEIEKEVNSYKVALGGKITCPNCHTEFIPNSDIDVTEAKEIVSLSKGAIEEFNEEIKQLQKDRDSFYLLQVVSKEKEIQALEGQKRKKSRLLLKIQEKQIYYSNLISQKEREIERINKSIYALELELTSQKESLSTNEKKLAELQMPSIDQAQIDSLEEKIKVQEDNIASTEEKINSIENQISEKKKWSLLIKQFYVYLTNKSLSVIEGYCNMFLQKINTDLQIRLEGYKTLSDGTVKESINPVIYRDGVEEEDYRSFSGGERGRLIFSTILTFQQLINQKSNSGGLGLLFVDEVLDQVDSEGIYNLVSALENINLTVLLTSQVKTKAGTGNTLTIVKEKGYSYIKEE